LASTIALSLIRALEQGRETWGSLDKEAKQTIYQETIYSGIITLKLDSGWGWVKNKDTNKKIFPIRCFFEGGWGYTWGKLTDGRAFHFALKLNIGVWNI